MDQQIQPQPNQQQEKPKKKAYQSWQFWAVISMCILMLIVFLSAIFTEY
ncbi:MAG: hypothetical protein WCT27_00485 [Patescibacteria group bacterium]|jgi:hypothetical protein